MKKCITGTEGFTKPDGTTLIPAGGAIGYMDGDTGSKNTATDKYIKLRYNGVSANRTNVRNGAYEFYTIGHMYADSNPLSSLVVNFVRNPANMVGSKAAFWAAATEMNFARGTDTQYPAKGTPTNIIAP
jgi:hypothetical protein